MPHRPGSEPVDGLPNERVLLAPRALITSASACYFVMLLMRPLATRLYAIVESAAEKVVITCHRRRLARRQCARLCERHESD